MNETTYLIDLTPDGENRYRHRHVLERNRVDEAFEEPKTMTREEIMEKNLTLGFEFSLYVAQHPEFASQIPPNSRVVLLPGDDPELAQINRQSAENGPQLDDEPNRPVIFVKFDRLLPARSRLARPRLVRTRRTLSRV